MTDYSKYPHMTEEQFYNHCDSIAYEDDFYREDDQYIVFCNSAGCMLAKLEKGTGVYWDF